MLTSPQVVAFLATSILNCSPRTEAAVALPLPGKHVEGESRLETLKAIEDITSKQAQIMVDVYS